MSNTTFFIESSFSSCPDPRKCRIQHKLTDIIGIVILGTICGEETWDGLSDWAQDQIEFLQPYLSLQNGVPSADTLRRGLERLDPSCFLEALIQWAEESSKRLPGQICIDVKTLRKCDKGKGNLHLVNAWCEQNRITLGSVASHSKGKEIPLIKELLEAVHLQKQDIVSIDAIGCQKEIVKKITQQDAEYLIALKANQHLLYQEVDSYFQQAEEALEYAPVERYKYERTKGDRHEIFVSKDLDWSDEQKKWAKLKSIVMVKRNWVHKDKKREETRYYITSLEEGAKELGERIRRHWSIENEYHWHLDVTFREDDSLISGKANRNLRVAREVALLLLRKETSAKMGIKRKMRKCARSNDYFRKVLMLENI